MHELVLIDTDRARPRGRDRHALWRAALSAGHDQGRRYDDLESAGLVIIAAGSTRKRVARPTGAIRRTAFASLQATGRVGPTPSLSLKPGARLVREWGGRTHTVTVTEDGFAYAGTSYLSLTKIAKKITGARWSGPRFFGLLAAGSERPSNGGRDG